MRKLGKLLALLAVTLVVLALVLRISGASPTGQFVQDSSVGRSGRLRTPTPPSQAALQKLKQNPTFQYLVSYTDQGFEPSTLAVKKGDTVRFTNNSTQELWVASIGQGETQIYPGTSDCGGSSFDSCGTLQPGDFWQFTFTESGTYDFRNNLDTSQSGAITITVQ